jgi:hypothetical protein
MTAVVEDLGPLVINSICILNPPSARALKAAMTAAEFQDTIGDVGITRLASKYVSVTGRESDTSRRARSMFGNATYS